MSENENIQVIKNAINDLNARKLDTWEDYNTHDLLSYNPNSPEPMTGQQVLGMVKGFIAAFPDLHYDMERFIAQDDFVVMHWRYHGTHTGPMSAPGGKTIPPTGRHVMVSGCSTYQFKDGKIHRVWAYFDRAHLLGQLGLLPEM